MKLVKYIFLIIATVVVLSIPFRIKNYYFINNNNLISMLEKKGTQTKLIKKIPENVNLDLESICSGDNTSLDWDNTTRKIKFETGSESEKCNLIFKYEITLGLSETSGTILKSQQKEVEITGENYGTLSCETNTASIATCSITENKLKVTGVGTGNAVITVRENLDNKSVSYNVTVNDITLGLTPTSGSTTLNKTLSSTITGSNYGTLSCITSDSLIATCSISGATLTIKAGNKAGTATITVKENLANKSATYTANVDVLRLSWVRMFGGTSDDYFWDVVEAPDGGYVAAGNAFSGDIDIVGITKSYDYDATAILVKYDASGNLVWKKFFGGSDTDYFNGVTAVSDGYVAVGTSWSNDRDLTGLNPGKEFVATIVKYDLNGNLLWKKVKIGHGYEKVVKVLDGVIVVGTKQANYNWTVGGGPSKPRAAYIVKYGSSGNVLWQTYCHDGSTNDSQFTAIAETNGGVVAVGNKSANYSSTGYFLIAKYSSSGTKLWEQAYGESGVWAKLTGVAGGNEIVAVGTARSEATMAKLNNSNGNVIWSYSYPGNLDDEFNDITAVSDGYFVSGGSYSTNVTPNKGGQDGLIIKVNTNGSLVWARNFGGSGSETFNAITASSNKFVAAGSSNSNNGDNAGINKGRWDATIYNFDY